MRKLFLLLLFVLGMGASVQAQPLVSCPFQDTAPFTCTLAAGGPVDLTNFVPGGGNQPGTCASGITWNSERVAPGADGTAFNNRGYAKATLCEFDVSGQANGNDLYSGYELDPPALLDALFPAVVDFYLRFRIKTPTGIILDNTAATTNVIRTFKFFMAHNGVYDGDQRAILFLERGDVCTLGTITTHVCVVMGRNILTGNFNGTTLSNVQDAARANMTVNVWHSIQAHWRHGINGISRLDLWIDNPNEGSPTSSDTNLTGTPTLPDGTTTWHRDDSGYTAGGFKFAHTSSNNTRFEDNFEMQIMDWEIDNVFDPDFDAGGGEEEEPELINSNRLRIRAGIFESMGLILVAGFVAKRLTV